MTQTTATKTTNNSSLIGGAVREFFAGRLLSKKVEFRISELYSYVSKQLKGNVAPGSPDRIMRSLRNQKLLSYSVIDRAGSKYMALGVTL